MRFQPGQSGNPGGRPNERPWRDAIRGVLAERDPKTQRRKLWRAAQALVDQAMAGDVPALKEIGDRLDGRAVQQIVGDPNNPVTVGGVLELRLVKVPSASGGVDGA